MICLSYKTNVWYIVSGGWCITEEKELFSSTCFLEQLDAYLNGTFPKRDMLFVSNTPKQFQTLGCPNLPILMTRKHLYTVMNEKGKYKNVHYHDLGIETIKKLPFLLEDSNYVFKSSTREDSIVIVTKKRDKKGRVIIISMKKNGLGTYGGKIIACNVLTSIYGKDCYHKFIQRNIENGNLIYWQENIKNE